MEVGTELEKQIKCCNLSRHQQAKGMSNSQEGVISSINGVVMIVKVCMNGERYEVAFTLS